MRQDREWVDLAFLHALGRAHGVNVVIFQAHVDETLVGEDLQDSAEHGDRIAVPVALVNDHHFWGGGGGLTTRTRGCTGCCRQG